MRQWARWAFFAMTLDVSIFQACLSRGVNTYFSAGSWRGVSTLPGVMTSHGPGDLGVSLQRLLTDIEGAADSGTGCAIFCNEPKR